MVSVVVTCYNREKYIVDAISSVVSQTYKNWELVIVDDGSTDKSLEVIKKLIKIFKIKDKIKIIKHDKNEGCGSALRDAINHSSGDLIAILDSDDTLASKALEIMVSQHKNNSNASLCYSNMVYCDHKLKPIKKRRTRQIKRYESCFNDKTDIVTHLKVFKKRFYDETEGISEGIIKSIDKDLIFKLEEVGSLIHVDAYLYNYRQHKNSMLSIINRDLHYKKMAYKSKTKVYDDTRKRRQNNSSNILL